MNISSRKWHQLKFATSWLIIKTRMVPHVSMYCYKAKEKSIPGLESDQLYGN